MNKTIYVKISDKFFYPEAYAYQKYLSKLNYNVKLIKNINEAKKFNLIIKFMGLDIFKKKKRSNNYS